MKNLNRDEDLGYTNTSKRVENSIEYRLTSYPYAVYKIQ
jgi:hypothetical protein